MPNAARFSDASLARFIDLRANFALEARALRREFESRFADPRRTFSTRFVWDYWHIPNQYTVIRTPARAFFSPKLFRQFEDRLLNFGGEVLGCNGISEPWLSYYIDGCSQNLHSDSPHGPWAYVFSLTSWEKRKFTGGETLVAKPELLDYWANFRDERGSEIESFFREIPARMNQLLTFDPRLPHGVKEVRGVKDPREGRLVIHGWFTEPRPFLTGALGKTPALARKASKELDEQLAELTSSLGGSPLHGSMSFRLEIAPTGRVTGIRILKNTLVDLHDVRRLPREPEGAVRAFYSAASRRDLAFFPRSSGRSTITVPLLFRS